MLNLVMKGVKMKLAKILAAVAFGMVCQGAVAMDDTSVTFDPTKAGGSVVRVYDLPTPTHVTWPPIDFGNNDQVKTYMAYMSGTPGAEEAFNALLKNSKPVGPKGSLFSDLDLPGGDAQTRALMAHLVGTEQRVAAFERLSLDDQIKLVLDRNGSSVDAFSRRFVVEVPEEAKTPYSAIVALNHPRLDVLGTTNFFVPNVTNAASGDQPAS